MTEAELRQAAEAVLRRNLRRGVSGFSGQAYSFCVPSPTTYPYQWFWDSCFHAIVWTYFDMEQAKEELRTLLRAQAPDGHIPHRIAWEKRSLYPYRFYLHSTSWRRPIHSRLVQPAVLAIALETVYQRSGDRAFLEETLLPVHRFYEWLAEQRDPDDDGLISIVHPYESGLDHRPAYDVVFRLGHLPPRARAMGTVLAVRALDVWNRLWRYDLPALFRRDRFNVEDVLVNCIYAQGLASLSRLWAEVGDQARAAATGQQASRVEQAILSKCAAEDDLYYDLYSRQERKAQVGTVTCLFPLILDSIDREAVERIIKEHLLNEKEFWLPYPLPTVSRDEPTFEPTFRWLPAYGLWRGPTWVNINWFVVRGLQKHGYEDIAKVIIARTRELVEKGSFRECYNPFTGQPYGARSFAWTTLIVDMIAG